MLSTNELDTLKKMLEEDKKNIEEQLDLDSKYTNKNASLRETSGELSAYDNHPADLGTELFERERESALEDHQDSELDKINDALDAFKDGSYGICKECGKDIPFERLEALPSTLYCIEHTPDQTVSDHRPVEEDILEPSNANTFRHGERQGVIDTEDSFEEVARFGTSETPSDLSGNYERYNELYDKGKNEETFTEDYEAYAATDITGKERTALPSDKRDEYENMLDRKGLESKIGDIPYKKSDGYVEDKE